MSSPPLEWVQLVGAALDGDASPAEMDRLREMLHEDAAFRRYYLDQAALSSMLQWEHVTPSALTEDGVLLGRKSQRTWWPWLAGISAAAAVITLVAIWPNARPSSPVFSETESEEIEPVFHARLMHAEEVLWDPQISPNPLELGDWLPDGRVRLQSGRITLTFDSGAMVSAIGPVALDVEGPNRGFVHYGRLVAFVPEQAQGFVLNTPTASLIDLGTRFGTSVADDGATEVHVIEGRVEVAHAALGNMGAPQVLDQEQALRLTEDEVERIPYQEDLFAVDLQKLSQTPSPEPRDYIYWAFDEGSGRATKGVSTWDEQFVGVLEGSLTDTGRWVPGVHGTAIAFDGETDWLSTDYPGIEGADPRTVAFWLKTPPKASGNDVPAILTWGGFESEGSKWELVPNPYLHSGAVGAVRVSCKNGFVVGATDIQNGRWHHVAVVFSGGSHLVNHIRIYIDGKLEPITGFLRGIVDTDVRSKSSMPLTLGRYVDTTQPIEGHLRGVIDELYLFQGALTPHEIHALWQEKSDQSK